MRMLGDRCRSDAVQLFSFTVRRLQIDIRNASDCSPADVIALEHANEDAPKPIARYISADTLFTRSGETSKNLSRRGVGTFQAEKRSWSLGEKKFYTNLTQIEYRNWCYESYKNLHTNLIRIL